MDYAIKELCWVSKAEKRLGVDITDMTDKKVNNKTAVFQPTSSESAPARRYEDWCIVASLTDCSSSQNIWTLPKDYSVKKELQGGDSVEVWSDGKEIMLNKLTKEKQEEIRKQNKEKIKRIKEILKKSREIHQQKKIKIADTSRKPLNS